MNRDALRTILIVLTILGTAIPYYFLVSHVAHYGVDVNQMYHEVASSRLGSFGWVDVIISAIALIVFTLSTARVSRKQAGVVIASTLLVGVSAGLPLLFYFMLGSKQEI